MDNPQQTESTLPKVPDVKATITPPNEEELDYDSQDLQIKKLVNTIKRGRDRVLSSNLPAALSDEFLSIPEIVSQHSKRLGMSDEQFQRTAARQGLDLGELIQGVGRQGRDEDEVLSELETKGMVSLLEPEKRKEGVQKLGVTKRGEDIRKKAISRLLSGEKRIAVDDEDAIDFDPLEDIDFQKIPDPTQRQGAIAALVYRKFADAGLSEAQARAVLANGFAESGLNPKSKNITDDEESYGIWQFNRTGSGEGVNYSPEELSNPRVQVDHIINAIKERDELAAFRDPDADEATLVREFMVNFERPKDQSDKAIKRRQKYLGQTKRLMDNAKKIYGTDIRKAAKERSLQRDLAIKLMGNNVKDYRIVSDDDFKSGDATSAVVKPGSKKYDEFTSLAESLSNPDAVSDPESKDRARFIQQKIAEVGEQSSDLQNIFSENQKIADLIDAGTQYDCERWAKKRGMSFQEFIERAESDPNSRENRERAKIRVRNIKHVALFRTVGKLGTGSFFSYDLIDPDNALKEDRASADDSWLSRFSDAYTSQRVELLGLDSNNIPVYRAESGLYTVFNMMDILLNAGAGTLERLGSAPEDESFFESVKEGTIEGTKDKRTFMKAALSTQGAKESDLKAFGYGSLGLMVDVFAPDPTFGLAKAMSVSGKLAKNLVRLRMVKGTVPKVLPRMESAALEFTDAQSLMSRAEASFRAGNDDEALNFLNRAQASLKRAEEAEKEVRGTLKQVMNNVDIVDGRIAEQIARDVPGMSPKNIPEGMGDALNFTEFGLRVDYLHPAYQRAALRGAARSQPATYDELLDMSRRIDRFKDALSRFNARDFTLAGYGKVSATKVDEFHSSLVNKIQKLEVLGKTKNVEAVTQAQAKLTSYLTSVKAAQDLTDNPSTFQTTVRGLLGAMEIDSKNLGKLDAFMETQVVKLSDEAKSLIETAKKIEKAPDTKKIRAMFSDSLRSMTASVESRAAAHALQRADIAKAEGIQIEPILASAVNKYEEVGLSKISVHALDFRRQIETAYPALKGEAAAKISRHLDETLQRIADDTGLDIGDVYETRFKGLVNARQKPAAPVAAPATKAPGSKPRVSKLALDDELITTEEVRKFSDSLNERLAQQDMSDFTASLATKTVKDLKALAKARGIKGYSKLRKSDLIDRIVKNDKSKAFLPDEYLAQNPNAAAQYEQVKKRVIDAQKDFEKAIDELDAFEAAAAPTVRELIGGQSGRSGEVIEAMMEASPDTRIMGAGGVQVRIFARDLAEGRVRVAAAIRDQRIAEVENFRRVIEGRAADTIELAEELDFVPGMIFRVESGNVAIKSIELPESLRGKGIATAMYLEAIKTARKRGLGVSSDINPGPESVRIYERLIDQGIPFARKASLDANGNESIEFVLAVDDAAKLSDDVLDVRRFGPEADVVDDVVETATKIDTQSPLLVEFLQDGQAVIRSMNEAATVEDFMLAVNKIARRELSDSQMSSIVDWLKTRGITVSHKGARFIADDVAQIQRAEDEFAAAFSDYAKGKPSPVASTDSAFERVKKFVTGSYAAARNAEVDGVTNNFSDEITEVFDSLLKKEPPTRFSSPNLARMMKRALYKDMTKGGKASVIDQIVSESTRLGYPISRADLEKKVDDAMKAMEEGRVSEAIVDLPGPVKVGGFLAEEAKSSFSLDEIMNAQTGLIAREQFVLQSADRLPIYNKSDSVKELKPSERIDQLVAGTKGIRTVARSVYLGGDAIEDLRHLPPAMRNAVMDGTRKVQQVIGDSVTLISENRPDEFRRFMVGDPTVTFKSGRNAMSAGHDKVASFKKIISNSIFRFGEENELDFKDLRVYLAEAYARRSKGEAPIMIGDKWVKAERAIQNLIYSSQNNSSAALQDIFKSAGLFQTTEALTPKHQSLMESLLFFSGHIERNGKHISDLTKGLDVPSASAKQFDILMDDIAKIFPQKNIKDPPVKNRIAVLMAAHGQAEAARKSWGDLGIMRPDTVAENFKKVVAGEALETIEHRKEVEQMLRLFGFNPRFVSMSSLDGVNFYVPESARKKLSMALEQALDPEVRNASKEKNLIESLAHLGETATKEGIITASTNKELFAAWSFRYMKTRMVRGHFLLKSRYFWMNTFDHFNQLGMVAGFAPALVSTIRLIPQDLLANPIAQGLLFTLQKAGMDTAGETARRFLQNKGDAGAQFAQKILRSGKWKISVNDVLEGREGFILINGVPQSFKQIREDALAYGVFASFDTSQLGTKIRLVGEEFARSANETGLTGKLGGMANVISPITNQFSQLSKISEDIAEAWGERERLGAMITLMEMGYDSKTAARITIDALYDYAGSMSKIDRHWLVNIFFPFWAFQKNANRQLLDTIMSPYGAYRLGVLRRSYFGGTELISEMLYNDMVDPLGVDPGLMNDQQRDVYELIKIDLVTEFGSLGNVPPAVRRQVQMFIRGVDSVIEGGVAYKRDARRDAMQAAYVNFQPSPTAVRVKPDRSLVAEYDRRRARILVPASMRGNVEEYVRLKNENDGEAPFTSILLPEQGFMSGFNHATLVTATLAAMGEELRSLGPDYFTDEDDGQDLFGVLQPLLDLIQPDRALLASDALAAMGMAKAGAPVRVHPILAKILDQQGIDLLPVEPKESPVLKQMKYVEEGPYKGEAFLSPTTNYFLPPGIARLVLENSPLGELNKILLMGPKSTEEHEEGVRSIYQWLRRAGVDIREIDRKQLSTREGYRLKDEAKHRNLFSAAGQGTFDEVKKSIAAPSIDPDDVEPGKPEKAQTKKKSKTSAPKQKQPTKDSKLQDYDAGRPVDL